MSFAVCPPGVPRFLNLSGFLLLAFVLGSDLLIASAKPIEGMASNMPDPASILSRIRQLQEEIAFHDRLYFVENAPVISDHTYDQLQKELAELIRLIPEEDAPPSTQEVHETVASTSETVAHGVPMLSLEKAYSEADWLRFANRVEAELNPDPVSFVIEPKYDGIAISLTYENGILISAATRGNGHYGQDITRHVLQIRSVPAKLNPPRGGWCSELLPDRIELRGELFILFEDFSKLNAEKTANAEAPYSSPRNYVAGAVRRTDSNPSSSLPLRVCIFGRGECTPSTILPPTQSQFYEWLSAMGLPVIEHYQEVSDRETTWGWIQYFQSTREQWDFPNDGLVIKVSSTDHQNRLGVDHHSPKWAIAYKFAPEQQETVLLNVEFQVGRTGLVTPVAEFESIELAGARLNRASLHSFRHFQALAPHYGDSVIIERTGDVIPQLAEIRTSLRGRQAEPIPFPANCPVCREPLRFTSAQAFCENLQCKGKLLKQLEYALSPQILNIEGIGPAALETLVHSDRIQDVADLFYLDPESIQLFPESTRPPLLSFQNRKRNLPLESYILCLGLPGVGPKYAQKLRAHVNSLSALMSLTTEEMVSAGIPPATATHIIASLQTPELRERITRIEQAGITPVNPSTSESGPLHGQTYVFSGKLLSMTRTEASQMLRSLGGDVKTTVSRNVNALIAGTDPGQKLEQARQLEVPILSEEHFLQLIAEATRALHPNEP